MNIDELDKKFEKMSRKCADSMSGTRPRNTKKTVKKTATTKKTTKKK